MSESTVQILVVRGGREYRLVCTKCTWRAIRNRTTGMKFTDLAEIREYEHGHTGKH